MRNGWQTLEEQLFSVILTQSCIFFFFFFFIYHILNQSSTGIWPCGRKVKMTIFLLHILLKNASISWYCWRIEQFETSSSFRRMSKPLSNNWESNCNVHSKVGRLSIEVFSWYLLLKTSMLNKNIHPKRIERRSTVWVQRMRDVTNPIWVKYRARLFKASLA